MKLKKIIATILTGVFLLSATACGNTSKTNTTENKVIKLGITGEDNLIWKSVASRLAEQGITLEVVPFTDYIIPNTALVDGEIDANAFQTEVFFDKFKEQSGADLSVLGYTILAPMAIYPGKVKSLEEITENGKVAIPNDVANGGRALLLLQDAGLIKVDPEKGVLPTVKDITEYIKPIEIVELTPAMIPTSIDEFDVACINNGVAKDSGLSVLDDSIYLEDTNKDYIKNYYNIIAVQTKDLEKEEIKKLLEVYQTEETKKAIDEEYKKSAIPVF